MNTDLIFKLICTAICIIIIIFYLTRRKKIISFIYGAIFGVLALFLICKFGYIIKLDVPFNVFNLCGSSVLGIPYVVLLAIICK